MATVEAPPLDIERWFNTDSAPTLAALRGKVVVLHFFQMLCPGCVAQALPQAKRLHEIARRVDGLVVLGVHSVFEHHAAMTAVSLEAFLHEYGIVFPVGIDRAAPNGAIPRTMATYGLQGTPSTIVVDRAGDIARHSFGADDDLVLGLVVGGLLKA